MTGLWHDYILRNLIPHGCGYLIAANLVYIKFQLYYNKAPYLVVKAFLMGFSSPVLLSTVSFYACINQYNIYFGQNYHNQACESQTIGARHKSALKYDVKYISVNKPNKSFLAKIKRYEQENWNYRIFWFPLLLYVDRSTYTSNINRKLRISYPEVFIHYQQKGSATRVRARSLEPLQKNTPPTSLH